jgi:alkylation response protein AidB-like acyl-CoA dehydrogenase
MSADRVDEARIRTRVREFLDAYSHGDRSGPEFWGARFDAGLAFAAFPEGSGGLGAPPGTQRLVDAELAASGVPPAPSSRNPIGLGMAAPTIAVHGTEEQKKRLLRPLFTGEEVWCQLFSEPGAGSDLAGLGTRAVRDRSGEGDGAGDGGGGDWIVTGQKVWTSGAHLARWALLLTRTDPDVPKHDGLTYFLLDMTAPGVEVRPLRQATGQAEFNEVFLDGARIPDTMRIGDVGQGWVVARTTLMNERVAIGGAATPREGGLLGQITATWRERPELHTPGRLAELTRLWADTEVARLTASQSGVGGGAPGPAGSALKLSFARLNQELSAFQVRMLGADGLRYDDWTMHRVEFGTDIQRCPGYFYLRAKGNSIEGGTSEVLRGIIAEQVLGLPREARADAGMAWKDIPR